jgi:phage tail-like protein
VSGLSVGLSSDTPQAIVVEPGLALDPRGREVMLVTEVRLALCDDRSPHYLVIEYAERDAEAARIEEGAFVRWSNDAKAGDGVVIGRVVPDATGWVVDAAFEAAVPPPSRHDPFSACNFLVEIDGIQSASFVGCSGLSSETEVIEYREGGEAATRKLPGSTKYGPVVLTRGVTTNRDLWEWRQSVVSGQTQRRNGVIVLLDEARTPVARWRFYNGWPAKYEGPIFNATSSEVAIESIEIVHEGLELE